MNVALERTVTDHVARRRFNIYRRADGRFWVLATPTNPYAATADNVVEFTCDTRAEALAWIEATR